MKVIKYYRTQKVLKFSSIWQDCGVSVTMYHIWRLLSSKLLSSQSIFMKHLFLITFVMEGLHLMRFVSRATWFYIAEVKD